MHCSWPYHLQSQGKIERSHRELRKKNPLSFDKARKKRSKLGSESSELARKDLSWKSPFKVDYGRMPNNIQNAGRYIPKQVIVDERIIDLPSARNFQEREENKKLRERVKKKPQTNGWVYGKKYTTLHKNIVYRKNDKVLVRIQGSRGKLGPKLRHVVEGTVVKKGKNSDNYQVIVQIHTQRKRKNMVLCRGHYQHENYAENEQTPKD